MKKVLSALLAAMLVISASITVFGATKSDVDKKISSSFAYLSEDAGENGYTTEKNLKDFYYLTLAGADVSAYKNAFLNSLKAALEADAVNTVDTAVLSAGILLNLGINPADFEGYDLTALLKEIPADTCANPYSLAYGIAVCTALKENETAKIYADTLAAYYEIGKGTDFWSGYGTSPDDLAIFTVGLSYLKTDYSDIINDALTLLETYYTENGYSNYGANADSTALALAAYSAMGNKEKADSIYDLLITEFYDAETGGFKAEYDPYYATADAVFGMAYYKEIADEDKQSTETAKPAETANPSASNKTEDKKQPSANTSKKSPATGASAAAAFALFAISSAGIAVLKKKENN